MTRIQTIEILTLRLPFRFSFGHSLAERSSTVNILVRLTLANGIVGYGEGVPRDYVTGETVDGALEALDRLGIACEEDPALTRMGVLLDGKLLTAPSVSLECGQSLSTSVEISGGFDRAKAEQYAALLGAPLPEGVQIVSSKP